MTKEVKRITSHPKLTAEKKAELREAAVEEQKLRTDPSVQIHDSLVKLKALTKRFVTALCNELEAMKKENN